MPFSNRKLGKDIHRLDNRIRRCLRQCPEHEHIDAVTGSNGHIIHFLLEREHTDVYQRDLESEFGITRSTASRVLDLMEKKGLITRQSVAHDKRLKKLQLTDKSRAVAQKMHENGQAVNAQLLRGFTPQETQQLYTFLDRMLHNLDEA